MGLCIVISCSNDDDANISEPDLTYDYIELLNGDFSNDFSSPTVLEFVVGKNFITASQGGGDIDYFTFTVPQNSVLSEIIVDDYQSSDSAGFIGIVASNAFSTNAGDTQAGDLLGGTLYGKATLGDDILPNMGVLTNATGFSGELPSGTYSIWLNQTGDTSTASFNFVVSKK
ncbi:hypothetical protein MHTCC0001_11350 [Flavobacteriaceae bacterium MHTCC 0001]